MADQFTRSKPRGATGPMHPKPPKLQKVANKARQILPVESEADFTHALKCAMFTGLFLAIIFGLLLWSAT